MLLGGQLCPWRVFWGVFLFFFYIKAEYFCQGLVLISFLSLCFLLFSSLCLYAVLTRLFCGLSFHICCSSKNQHSCSTSSHHCLLQILSSVYQSMPVCPVGILLGTVCLAAWPAFSSLIIHYSLHSVSYMVNHIGNDQTRFWILHWHFLNTMSVDAPNIRATQAGARSIR